MEKNEAMSNEQAADLSALKSMATDGEQPGEMQQAQAPDPAETWAMLPAMLGSTLAIGFPELRAVYSPEACRAWGEAMLPVADKYGWSAEGIIGPELALAAASLPFVLGTVGALKSRKTQEKAGPVVKNESAQNAPGYSSKTVIIGSPVLP